jgi:YegS/Rv2252/BmrU family lipid kinase
MKVLFIINPVSGGKEKRDWEEKIRTYFKQSPHNMEFYILTGQSDVVSVQHHINSINPDRVVGVGGDGTIKMLAQLLYHTPLPLGIIPAGSANGMARELGIPIDIDVALDIVVNGTVTPIDVIEIDDSEICIHLSDLGLNAMLVKQFEQSKNRGMWGYGKAVFRMLWQKQIMYVTIQTDTETVKRKAYMVAIANASKYGTGATINPDGKTDDGIFEIVVVRKLNMIEIGKAILTEKSFDPTKIEIFKTTKATLSTLSKAYFQIDGEYRGRVKKVKAKMQAGCLHILLPTPKREP